MRAAMAATESQIDDAISTRAAALKWVESNGSPQTTSELRDFIRRGARSSWMHDILIQCRIHEHARVFLTSTVSIEVEKRLGIARLLRDATQTAALQGIAVESGSLDTGLIILNDPGARKHDALVKSLVAFVANCSSHLKAQPVIIERLPFIDMIESAPEASSMIIFNLVCLHPTANSLEFARKCVRTMVTLFGSTENADVVFWLSHALATVFEKQYDTLKSLNDDELKTVVKGGVLLDLSEIHAHHIPLVVDIAQHRSAVTVHAMEALASFSAEHDLDDAHVRMVLDLAVRSANVQYVDENGAELRIQVLRLMANILNRAAVGVKHYFQAIGGIPILLNNTRLDPRSPTQREWAILAISAVCKDNEEAQRFIASLRPVMPGNELADKQVLSADF